MARQSIVSQNNRWQFALDGLFWILAVVVAGWLRYDLAFSELPLVPLLMLALVLGFLGLAVGMYLKLYGARFGFGSVDELIGLAVSATVATILGTILNLIWGLELGLSRTIATIAGPIFLTFSGFSRYLRRQRKRRETQNPSSKRVLIYGAGTLAHALITQLHGDPRSPYLPIGLLDDDPAKRDTWISGVKMRGTGADLESVIRATKAEAIIIAIPRANAGLFQRVERIASSTGAQVLSMPTFTEILQRGTAAIHLEELSIEDLLGRRSIDTEIERIRDWIAGKTVLVTGAGGSIGVELCRQVSLLRPKQLIFLDRDESALQQAQLVANQDGLLEDSNFVLADIRESEVISGIFQRMKPEIVFHAAALKHLPVLERFPAEAWKTNVLGTLNVLRAAQDSGTKIFINISTDKASDPTSVLGRSKQIAERLTAWFAAAHQSNYSSVRFGNVLGSRGSLIPTVSHLIKSGGTVKVTHPDVTRFFMTIPEACQLVLQSASMARGQDIFLLEMGEPVKILELVQKMVNRSGKETKVEFTGLRPGEKLHEELFSKHEKLEQSDHPLIYRIMASPLDPKDLDYHKIGTLRVDGV